MEVRGQPHGGPADRRPFTRRGNVVLYNLLAQGSWTSRKVTARDTQLRSPSGDRDSKSYSKSEHFYQTLRRHVPHDSNFRSHCRQNPRFHLHMMKKLALTSPTGGGRSVGIVRVRTKATEFSLVYDVITPTASTVRPKIDLVCTFNFIVDDSLLSAVFTKRRHRCSAPIRILLAAINCAVSFTRYSRVLTEQLTDARLSTACLFLKLVTVFARTLSWAKCTQSTKTAVHQNYCSSWTTSPLKMGPTGCPERSVTNCQSTWRNIQVERRKSALTHTIIPHPIQFLDMLHSLTH